MAQPLFELPISGPKLAANLRTFAGNGDCKVVSVVTCFFNLGQARLRDSICDVSIPTCLHTCLE